MLKAPGTTATPVAVSVSASSMVVCKLTIPTYKPIATQLLLQQAVVLRMVLHVLVFHLQWPTTVAAELAQLTIRNGPACFTARRPQPQTLLVTVTTLTPLSQTLGVLSTMARFLICHHPSVRR